MNNVTILDNPFSEGLVITTRGVAVDSKAAKLNNNTKRPALVKKWEDAKMNLMSKAVAVKDAVVDYASVLNKIGIKAVNYAKEAVNNGAKKLRVNEVVNSKASNIYNNVEKIEVKAFPEEKKEEPVVQVPTPPVMPTPSQEMPKEVEKPVMQERPVASMEPNVIGSRSDIHGRHEHTGEIPVDAIREAVRNNNPMMNSTSNISRVERNVINDQPREEFKQETNGVDMDLYTSLMQTNQDDVSKQLQGAKKELSIEKEESRKLAEQYGEAVKELEKLKEEIESKKKIKEQKDKQELSSTLNDLETIKRENLEKTSDLSAIRAEISKLEAQKRAMEENYYDDYRSFGRAA